MRRGAVSCLAFLLGVMTVAVLHGAEGVIRFGAPAEGVGVRALVPEPPEVSPPFAMAEKSRERAAFVSASDWCWTAAVTMEDGQVYTRLDLPGRAAGGEIGEPRIPYHGRFVRVPDGAGVRLVLDEVTWNDIPGAHTVAPQQEYPLDAADAPRPAFTRNATAYAADAWYPEAPVRIADRMRIRGREFVYVVYAPVAFNPARSALRAASRVAWRLEYDLPEGGVPAPRPDPVGEAAFAAVFDSAIDATVPDAFQTAGVSDRQASEIGADYLIITADKYLQQVAPLERLKSRMGLLTQIVALSAIGENPDANDITDFIRNAYQTWNPRPTYLLLVGDAPDLPPHDETAHPSRSDMPATDLYYAAVDGTDIFPDLLHGRLPCATLDDCSAMVNKIVAHQQTPDASPDYRNSALVMGYFQDVNHIPGAPAEPADGIEDRLFVETAEASKNFLESKGVTVHTVYIANSDVVPRRYNIDSLLHAGEANYVGSQEYVSSVNATTAVKARLSEGVAFVVYRAHGSVFGWDSLGAADVRGLGNGTRLPIVLSVTCQTGWFDYSGGHSLCEEFMRVSNGGAVAVVGSTRNSVSWWNDWFVHGMHESFWPDYLETLTAMPGYRSDVSYGDNVVGRSPRMGQAVNFAKRVMFDKQAYGSQGLARNQFEILMLFGDPHMHFQTWSENPILATHPDQIDAQYAQFFVTAVNKAQTPVSGASVRIHSMAGDNTTRTTGADGRAEFEMWPIALDHLTVDVTKTNMVPYSGRIELNVGTLTVNHPATVSAVTGGFVVSVYANGNVPLQSAVVMATSEAGDYAVRTTGADGKATFAFIPLSITTMDIQVEKRAYATYHGQIQMIPGTLTVQHGEAVDEGNSPVVVRVLDGAAPLSGVPVRLRAANGVDVTAATDLDGFARVPVVPVAGKTFQVDATRQGYTPYVGQIAVEHGRFVWSAQPLTRDLNGPFGVTVSLKSRLTDAAITNFSGTAEVWPASMFATVPPPSVVITDCRRLSTQSFVALQCVKDGGSQSLAGWMLACNALGGPIDSVHTDIKDLSGTLDALADPTLYRVMSTPAETLWTAPVVWDYSVRGWVLLLDAQTNAVDFVAWGWDADELAAFAPVVRGRPVSMTNQWDGDGIPLSSKFADSLASRRRMDYAQDSNMAGDFFFPGSSDALPAFSTPFTPFALRLPMSPETIGPFVSGEWDGSLTIHELGSNVVLNAWSGPRYGQSAPFDVIPTEHDHYAFSAISSPRVWNAPFAVTLEARDEYGNRYTNFNAQVNLYAFADATAEPVLITEVGAGDSLANYVEIHNLSGAPADTTGWKLLAGDDSSDIHAYNTVVRALPDAMTAGEVRYWHDGVKSVYPWQRWGGSLNWTNAGPGWVMLLDSTNRIVDFVAWGWSDEEIAAIAPVYAGAPRPVGGAWIGPGKPHERLGRTGWVGTLLRKGAVDRNCDRDWWWTTRDSRGAANLFLTVPLTEARIPVRMSPTQSGLFAGGVWTGQVKVEEDVDDIYLEAVDAAGLFGQSGRFDIDYRGQLTLTVPRFVREGDGTVTATVSTPSFTRPRITLVSTDTTEVRVPDWVEASVMGTAQFTITVMNDTLQDFTQHARILATASGHSPGQAEISVLDNDAPQIALHVPPAAVEGAGTLAAAGQVVLDAPAAADVVFTLASSDVTEIIVPDTVTIRAGRSNRTFDLVVPEDALRDGMQVVNITATPDNTIFATGTVHVVDNDPHAFAISAVGNVHTACVPFAVEIHAVDAVGVVVSGYIGQVALSASDKGGDIPVSPVLSGLFTAGAWAGALAVCDVGNLIWLTAQDGDAEGVLGPLTLMNGPLDHFRWTVFGLEYAHAGAWLNAQVSARDAHGFRVENLGALQVPMTAERHDPGHPVRLLTFVRYADAEGTLIRMQTAIRDHFPMAVETHTVATNALDLAAELALSDVFLLPPQPQAAPGQMAQLGTDWGDALGAFVDGGGVVVGCAGISDEHVLLRDAGLADLMLESLGAKDTPFVELAVAATNALTAGVAGQFVGGDAVGLSSAQCQAAVRSMTNGVAAVMHRVRGAGHVVMIGSRFESAGAEFDRILANAVRLGLKRVPQVVSSAPTVVGPFGRGVWSGAIQVGAEGLDTVLRVHDGDGHEGATAFFDIAPLRLGGFRRVAGDAVFNWNSAGVTPYTIERGTGRPDGAYEPCVTNILATPPLNTFTGRVEGASPGFYRLSVPSP